MVEVRLPLEHPLPPALARGGRVLHSKYHALSYMRHLAHLVLRHLEIAEDALTVRVDQRRTLALRLLYSAAVEDGCHANSLQFAIIVHVKVFNYALLPETV